MKFAAHDLSGKLSFAISDMTKTIQADGRIAFEVTEADIESAVRMFICACHPETVAGFVINPQPNLRRIEVPTDYIAFTSPKPTHE